MEKSRQDKYKRNIFSLTLHLAFSKRITGPIMMIFYQSFGLSFGQIGTLSSIAWLTDAAFEVNGGAFSDVYGRRVASMIYAFLGMLGMLLFVFGKSFPVFAAASIIYGISIAVGSGNASALLFDTLKMLKLEKQYKRFSGKIRFPAKLLNGLIFLALPALYKYNIHLPFVLGFALYSLSFFTACFFIIEPPKSKGFRQIKMLETVKSSLLEIWRENKIKQIILIDVILSGFSLLCLEYYQPIIKAANISLAYFGIIYAMLRVFEALGSLFLHKINHSDRKIIFVTGVTLAACVAGFAFFHSWIILVFIFLAGLNAGGRDVIISDLLNKNISSENRTTIMSTDNLFDSLFAALLLFVFGFVSDRVGVQGMFFWALIAFVGLSLASFALVIKNNSGGNFGGDYSPAEF